MAVLAVLLIPVSASAWGPAGHEIVGKIADRYLDDAIRPAVNELLAVHEVDTLAKYSNWPDHIRRTRPETAPWHYVDIPITADRYDFERDCTNGQCIVEAIYRFSTQVGDQRFSISNRVDALSFLVHFTGDIHQPLHCGENNDRGGNDVKVMVKGVPGNMHGFWDYDIIQNTETNVDVYVETLMAKFGSDTNVMAKCQSGTVEDWANESHNVSRDFVYASLPPSRELDDDYIKSCRPVVDEQLFVAGVRLAQLLNVSFASGETDPAE